MEKGEPVPGIKDIDDRPPNPDVALPPVSEDFEERTRKPWSMKPSDDESFEGHRPWDKYGNGAAASGEYSFDGGGKKDKEKEEEDGRRLPCHRCPIQPGKRSGFSVIV